MEREAQWSAITTGRAAARPQRRGTPLIPRKAARRRISWGQAATATSIASRRTDQKNPALLLTCTAAGQGLIPDAPRQWHRLDAIVGGSCHLTRSQSSP